MRSFRIFKIILIIIVIAAVVLFASGYIKKPEINKEKARLVSVEILHRA